MLTKLLFLVFTLRETQTPELPRAKRSIRTYRVERALQHHFQQISVVYLTFVLLCVLYPSLMLTNDASECYRKLPRGTCPLTQLGEAASAILSRPDLFVLQYLVLLFTIWHSLYKLGVRLLRDN